MKTITSLCLTSLLVASANAATYNAQGKIINSKDAKNPGIVKFEKNKIATAKKNVNKPKSLAKTYPVDQVTPLEGIFDSDAYDGKYITLNGTRYYESDYISVINNYEQSDVPRSRYSSRKTNYYNSAAAYSNNSGYDCKKVSSIYAPDPYQNTFYYTFADLYENNFLPVIGLDPWRNRCYNSGWQQNTCGAGVNLYNVVGDNPISINSSNSCKNSTSRDYTLGINHLHAKRVINAILPEVNNTIPYSQTVINEGDARQNHEFAVYSKYPSSPYSAKAKVINNITTSTKNVNTYNEEAAGIDDYIYYNRVIEFAPYTENGEKTGAGLSLNAITVKEADEIGITRTHGVTKPYLKASVSASRYLKPEINQLSYIRDESNYIKLTKNNQNEYKIMGIADGWGGSTVAAAMSAGLISKYPFYAWHPEVVKAVWLTAQNDNNNVYDIYRFTGGYYPTGRPEAVKTGDHMATMYPLIKGNRSRYWYGNNGDFFNNEKITFTEDVEPGKKYSLAIAWLVSGNYTYNEKTLQSNYKMTVHYKNYQTQQGYTAPFTSTQFPSTSRTLSITIPSTVTQIEVVIERVKNSGDRVVLGYNLHKSN